MALELRYLQVCNKSHTCLRDFAWKFLMQFFLMPETCLDKSSDINGIFNSQRAFYLRFSELLNSIYSLKQMACIIAM